MLFRSPVHMKLPKKYVTSEIVASVDVEKGKRSHEFEGIDQGRIVPAQRCCRRLGAAGGGTPMRDLPPNLGYNRRPQEEDLSTYA